MDYIVMNRPFKGNAKLIYVLCTIFGVGKKKSLEFCGKLGFNKEVKLYKFTQDELDLLIKRINRFYKVGKDLEREKFLRIKLKQDIKSYQGIRYRMGLPVHGQRTKTNSKTVRKLLNRKV